MSKVCFSLLKGSRVCFAGFKWLQTQELSPVPTCRATTPTERSLTTSLDWRPFRGGWGVWHQVTWINSLVTTHTLPSNRTVHNVSDIYWRTTRHPLNNLVLRLEKVLSYMRMKVSRNKLPQQMFLEKLNKVSVSGTESEFWKGLKYNDINYDTGLPPPVFTGTHFCDF